jgi:hypothetical protein
MVVVVAVVAVREEQGGGELVVVVITALNTIKRLLQCQPALYCSQPARCTALLVDASACHKQSSNDHATSKPTHTSGAHFLAGVAVTPFHLSRRLGVHSCVG